MTNTEIKVVHALWLPNSAGPGLMVWCEGSKPRSKSQREMKEGHPFALRPEELTRVLPGLEKTKTARKALVLPGRGRLPLASNPIVQEALGNSDDSRPAYRAWEVPGLIVAPGRALSWLLRLSDSEDLRSRGILIADTLRFWQAAGRLAWEILAGEHFLPAIFQDGGDGARTSKANAVWQPALDAPAVAEKLRGLEEALPPVCLAFALDAESGKAGTDASAVVRDFLASVVDAEVRAASGAFPRVSGRVPHDAWMSALASDHPEFEAPPETADEIAGAISSWKARLEPVCGRGLRACLRLREPFEEGGKWMLEYLLQPTADPSLLACAKDIWKGAGLARKIAALSSANPEERLLASLSLAGRVFPPIEASLKRRDPTHVVLDSAGAYRFLKDAAPVLSNSGFGVFLPPWWKAQDAPRLSV
ncbi:MAG: hypothetical protein KGL04_08470, partial [Elusimicrobia bacterium]|nr:hypothetical protein [Elusimicrobiota bacterium]